MNKLLISFLLILPVLHSCSKGSAATMPPTGPGTDTTKNNTPDSLILWNGESKQTGVGWVSPVDSSMSISTEDSVVHSGNTAVEVHMAHQGAFLETGWQWSTWVNVTSVNFLPFSSLKLAVRVTGNVPDDLQLSLASPGDHHTTQRLSMKKYAPQLTSGEWQVLNVPLADFYSAGMAFDPKNAIQIIIGTWNDQKDFHIYLDDLTLIK